MVQFSLQRMVESTVNTINTAKICAQVKCYHCGYVSGQVCGEGDGDHPWQELRPNPTFRGDLPHAGEPLRCFRCHGPVYLDEFEKQRPPQVENVEEFTGRGRRRKRQVAA